MKPEELYLRMKKDAAKISDPSLGASLDAQIDIMYNLLTDSRGDARIDHLTQLPNYKQLLETLESITAHSQRTGEALVLGFVDLNELKVYNDTYGHVQANHAIRKAAETIKGSLRTQDFLARYGGDEFCFILPSTNLEGAKSVVERIKKNVDSLSIDAVVDTLPDNNYRRVSLSAGVTELREREDYMLALNRANQAMITSKSNSKTISSVTYV